MLQVDVEQFVAELDAAAQNHLDWTRRLLRCGILREPPADDVFDLNAHQLCRFGQWFLQRRDEFISFDADRAAALETAHRAMHDVARTLCFQVLSGEPGRASDLEAFERNQTSLIDQLAHFKTLAVAKSSLIDALTGLPMRHGTVHDFDLLQHQLGRKVNALLVAMIDIDQFKRINDEYGHETGDIVLRAVATVIRHGIRTQDQLYRYGGEEFLLLMPLGNFDDIIATTDKILALVRGLSVAVPGGAIVRPRVTIGAALAGRLDDLSSVLRRADAALYEGKVAGRDRCVIAASTSVACA
jgi:diguanylate cyclase (GGDEF)-like protein